MYLKLLNSKEKDLFLEMANILASSDGNYSEDEKEIINCYCDEMQIPFKQNIVTRPVEDIVDEINQICNEDVKRIFIYELIGLAKVDGDYDENERRIVSNMENIFDMETGFALKCEELIDDYIIFQERINRIILG